MMLRPLFTALALLLSGVSVVARGPTVTLLNGTYEGVSVASFHQEHFLGMPYAQQPLPPDLRLRPPLSLNTSWTGTHNATEYSPICIGYPSGGACDDCGYETSEACLTVNVIRPEGVSEGSNVPVVLWIYGGGFTMGGSADHRYNGSWIVQRSVEMGQPIIFTSLNYRVDVFGFMYSSEIAAEGGGNYGLLDQRLAMEWVHENIQAFGGDPTKVTIMGESAGAISVAIQMLAYGETSTDLFRAGILESGTAVTQNYHTAADYQSQYDAVVNATGCANSTDTLTCLRAVPVDEFVDATNVTLAIEWGPVVDGAFLTQSVTAQVKSGQYIMVPLLLGANLDEGGSFGPTGMDNETAIAETLLANYPHLTNTTIYTLLGLYPNDPLIGCPFFTGDGILSTGTQDKRAWSIYGDIYMHAGRRMLAQSVAQMADVYSYHFAQPPDNATIENGVGHFQEVAFVFSNPLPTQNPLSTRPGDLELANLMTSYWVSFVHNVDPNYSEIAGAPYWPSYRTQATNLVFKRQGSYVELDTWRAAGITFLNTLEGEMQH